MLGNMLAALALQPQNNLLGGLGLKFHAVRIDASARGNNHRRHARQKLGDLLVKHWLGLTSKSRLLPVITTFSCEIPPNLNIFTSTGSKTM